ncbi:hypothetical protein CDL12_21638 [Handroanthus impetiginosus]|uniref:Uncharacterized protein n=1 Tax=Handroanthus impetiginosus TaxID=429701 RepID=A0A2G9GKL7_9LAMI|nr:hypothetical protein CDL12_21638 [Handroanthus impetiginosus]
MGVHVMEIGIKMGKGVIFTIRGCFRSICNHPFLVGMLCFLIFMYRSSPFMFSLLVSASPILVCTAVLLGTLLSFGQPNVPEVELEQKTTREDVLTKSGVSRDAFVVEQSESCYVERYGEKRRDAVAQSDEELSLLASKFSGSSHDKAPSVEERLPEIELGGNWELRDMMNKQKSGWNEERVSDGEVVESQYASNQKANDEHLESEDEKSGADSFDSETVNVDALESPPRSPWKRVEDREDEEEEEEDDGLDSGSDGAESSSPDASMADIMPMLDELHPLLDEDAPPAIQMSRDGSDAASVQSLESSSSSSRESDDETENQEDLEVADDEDEQGDKEEQTKPAIVWTEEDQKNLMDLGSSEIERNQRLENLMLRRKARKHVSMVPEINLIDLESSDPPFHIAPISTTRQNPFDLPNDSYDNSGLPPIPGSAPSILLPRRNPFDIPYDSNEDKLNTGDGFQEDLTGLQSREPFFRRHESFNVGPSIFVPNRQEKHDIKLRPYFVPERMVSEEPSYSPFDRQSSEVSDSRLSSVPETESAGSVEDSDDQKLAEEDNRQELELTSTMEEVIQECQTGDQEQGSKEEVSEEDVPREPELISEMKHVAEHIGHGSQSSEEEDSLESGEFEKRDVDFDDHHYEEGSVARPGEQAYSRGSSSSPLSEVGDRVFNEAERERLLMSDVRRDTVADEPDAATQTSVGGTDPNVASTLPDDIPHKEPVYDSSPPAVRKNLSSSSGLSDVHAESDPGLPPVLVKRMVSFAEKDSEGKAIEKEILSDVEMLPESARVDNNVQDHDNIKSNSDMNIRGPVKSSDDKNLGKSEEKKHLLISVRQNLLVKAAPSEGQVAEMVQSPDSDADVYHEANEKLIVTPSAGGSTPLFYDIAMHEPDFEHVEEVQVPNTPVESFERVQSIQNLNIPEIHELDHDVSSNTNSPLAPDFISMPSSVAEEASSHVDTQTRIEEADEIKEIDEGLLSELDSVGDFSVTQWGSDSNEFEKHIHPIAESSSSAQRPESNITKVVEVNEIEHARGEQYLTDQITSEKETFPKENEANSANSVHISETPVVDKQSIRDDDSSPKKAGLTYVETEVMEGSPNVPHDSRVDIDTASKWPELTDSDKEIEKSVVLEPPQAELVVEETIVEHHEHETTSINTSPTSSTHEKPILEVRSIEDANLDHKQVDGIQHVVDSDGTRGEGTSSSPKKVIDDNIEKELKLKTNDVSADVDAKEIGSSVADQKPHAEVKAPEDLHSTSRVKGKGKKSKSSSSSSSSSSESGSSDSDRE